MNDSRRWSRVVSSGASSARFSGRVITPITSIVLAHLLVPADFGIFSVAVVAQLALLSFNDLGISNAIVWWKGDVKEAARTATTLAIIVSGTLFGLCVIAAPFIAEAMSTPAATGVIRLLSVSVVIDGIASVPVGLLNREFQQKRRAAADWVGFITSTGLTIGLAAAGFGAWSLAWGRLVGNVVLTSTLYALADHRPRPGWSPSIARALLRYGLPLAGASLLVFTMLNVDYVVVARVLGPGALGLYTIAFNLASWPSNVLSQTIRRVSIPTFSHLQDEKAARRDRFLAGERNLMLPTLLLCAGLGALAIPFIALLYPPLYQGAAGALAFLAILGAARVLIDFMYDFLAGIGRTRVLLPLQGLWTGLLIPGLWLGARMGGIRGVAIAHAVIAVGIMVPVFSMVMGRSGVPARAIAAQLARPTATAVLGAAAALIVVGNIATPAVAFVAGGVTLVALYLLIAAPRREIVTLPRRFLRFEPATD